MSDNIPKLTPEMQLDMKRTLLALYADQYNCEITNVYIRQPDGTIKDETEKYII